MSPATAFESIRSALEHAHIRFAIGGSWASTTFGEPRFTNDVDILAELTPESLTEFLRNLPAAFYSDPEGAREAIRRGRPFNVIHMPTALKFDLFPAHAFPLGSQELDRAVLLPNTAISATPAPFVTAEDIILAKLHWYRTGGESSQVQWRDICGIIKARAANLDLSYLETNAATLKLSDLLKRALDV